VFFAFGLWALLGFSTALPAAENGEISSQPQAAPLGQTIENVVSPAVTEGAGSACGDEAISHCGLPY
jgi:hypothetical protein